MTDSTISDLCPDLQVIYRDWLTQCHAAGLAAKAIVTWRNSADQATAKANGLSNAGAGESPHNCVDDNGAPASKAFDFGIFNSDASYVTDGGDPRYRQAGEIGKGLGLVYGGDWTSLKDMDHLELSNWKTTT